MKQKRTLGNLLALVRPARCDRRSFVTGFLAVVGLVGSVAAGAAIDLAATAPKSSHAAPANTSTPVSGDAGWAALSATRRSALAPLHKQWTSLDAAAQARWIHVADRLQGMPASAVARAQARMEAWQRLPQDRREHARQRFEVATRLSVQERARRWRAYQASLDAHPAAATRPVVRDTRGPPTPTEARLRPARVLDEQEHLPAQDITPSSGAQPAGLPS